MLSQLNVAGFPILKVEAQGGRGTEMSTIAEAAEAAAAVPVAAAVVEGLIETDTGIAVRKVIIAAAAVEASVAVPVGAAALHESEVAAGKLRTGLSVGLMREKSPHMRKGIVLHQGVEAHLWVEVLLLVLSLQYTRTHLEEGGVYLLISELQAEVAAVLQSLAPAAALQIQMINLIVLAQLGLLKQKNLCFTW